MHIKTTYGRARTFLSMLGEKKLFVVMSTISVRKRNFDPWIVTIYKEDH
jgi:hypothetical protein